MLNLVANGPSGYNLTNSLRFRSSASAYLSRTPATASNRKTWTWSGWVKRGALSSAGAFALFGSGSSGSNQSTAFYFNNDAITFQHYIGGGVQNWSYTSAALFRDISAWYHVVLVVDTTQASSANGVKLYINGVQQTFPYTFGGAGGYTQNQDLLVNFTNQHQIAQYFTGSYLDGYLAEVNFIDGQALTPSSFGSTNATTGVWQPAKYTGTYGTNGFYLNFNSIALTSGSNAGLGKDNSGNGNYWNTNNISVTAGTTYDAMTDVPTLTSATVANYCVLNPLNTGVTPSQGNLTITQGAASWLSAGSTIIPSTGKYYYEGINTNAALGTTTSLGLKVAGSVGAEYAGQVSTSWGLVASAITNLFSYNNGTATNTTAFAYNSSTVFQVAVDYDAGKIWLGYNNNWLGGGSPASGTTPTYTFTANTPLQPIASVNAAIISVNFGQQGFAYTPPTGFVALNTYNLPTPTILQGNKYMDATLYTGNGSSGKSVTNAASFKPDLVWIKDRSAANYHILTDSVRGVGLALYSNGTFTESAFNAQTLQSFNSNGFTVGSNGDVNTNTNSLVGWQWQAGQGSSSSNTSGSITSTVSVNATAGFSVVTYTGTGANATVGHGLGVAPKMYIVKKRSATSSWVMYHGSLAATQRMILETAAGVATDASVWNSTAPTSSVFSIGNDAGVNGSAATFVAYCWAAISGYSAFGNYTGNGSTDGSFVYTGFLPRFVMIKRTDTTGDWYMWDTARNTFDVITNTLLANSSAAETSATSIDALSNGFKLRNTTTGFNASGGTYIYAAFASNPFRNSNAF